MSLKDYQVVRDHFEADDINEFAFPCCACQHRMRRRILIAPTDQQAPCRTCDHNGAAVQDVPNAKAPFISDDEILSLWRTVRPSVKQDMAMVYQSGPDDFDHPTFELRRIIELAMNYNKVED